MALIATSDLLTLKKTICDANLSEDEVTTPEQSRHYMAVKQLADEEGSPNFTSGYTASVFFLALYRQFDSALDVQSHHFVGITLYILLYMFIFNQKFCY